MHEDIYRDIVRFYGRENQSRQAMEECAELIQAINKALRYPEDEQRRVELITEMADVEIMLFQLMEIFGICKEEVLIMRAEKKRRLIKKYKEERDEKTD